MDKILGSECSACGQRNCPDEHSFMHQFTNVRLDIDIPPDMIYFVKK